MNKREQIHALVDRIMDIEETSKKGVQFTYRTSTGFDFYFLSRPKGTFDRIGSSVFMYFEPAFVGEFEKAMAEILKVKETPDIEPKINFALTEAEARNLGLITSEAI